MTVRHPHTWTINSLPWDRFDPTKVDPDLLKIVKAAALVEYNAKDYATYLCNVFPDDTAFCTVIRQWAVEETQHGEALGRWAERADRHFDFARAFQRYTDGFHINFDANQSIRGSKTGELIARCIVETGTSSYYNALGDATDEPVLKALCRNITADELRHYKLFHGYLKIYAAKDEPGKLARLKIGMGRILESEDDELAFAYFAANIPNGMIYDRPTYTREYMIRACKLYRADHIERMVSMVFRACNIKLSTFWRGFIKKVALILMRIKLWRAMDYRPA